LLFRNVNTYGDLSSIYKDDKDYKLLSSILYNIKYPLIKISENNRSFLTPILSLRYSPNKGLNLKNNENLISFQDLFVIDRIDNNTVEHGLSTTLGLEYKKIDTFASENIKLGLAVNLRDKEDKDLPISSSLGEKTSDIIGYSGINISKNISIQYDFSLDQNLNETNYSLLSTKYKGGKFNTSFEYMEKSKHIGDESYLTNLTEFNLNESNSIGFETNKNLDKNLTNYYNLIYEYKNDCLEASLVYNKQFYENNSLNSGKNIFFKISLKPFGTINTPSIND